MTWFIKMTRPCSRAALFMSLLIAGCGFHLRGMVDMPTWLDTVSVMVQSAHHDLESLLTRQLQSYHIKVYPDPKQAHYWLIIEHDDTQQQIVSVSSGTTARQYQLIYTVQFKLQAANGREIIPTSQVMVTRQVTINSDRILGSNNEQDVLKSEMRRNAVVQILARLNRKIPAPPSKHAH